MISDLVEYERKGFSFAHALNRPDLPDSVLKQPISFLYAQGFGGAKGEFVSASRCRFTDASLTVGGLFALTLLRHDGARKDQFGVSFMTRRSDGDGSRKADNAESWTGIALDDDNHENLGREATTMAGGPLRCCFGTFSDGKASGSLRADAFKKWAQQNTGNSVARPLKDVTDDEAAAFLNDRKAGNPCRSVELLRTTSGLPKLTRINGEFEVPYRMAPQVRTRTILPFAKPIDGKLLGALRSQRLVKVTCLTIAQEVFGAAGFDESTMTINAVAYLPSGCQSEFFHQICGDAYLLDAVSIAESVLKKHAAEPQRQYASKKVVQTSEGRSRAPGGLKGLLLATWLKDNAPELVRAVKQDARGTFVVLHACPFSDSHGSKPGQADGSCHIHDGDPDSDGFPWIACKHDTCKGRSALEYTRQMIAVGDLPSNIYKNQQYRIV